jgi:hypothetical protein
MPCEHDWAVYGAGGKPANLFCECALCHANGCVRDTSSQELAECASRIGRPYRWPHRERVTFERAAVPLHFVEANPDGTIEPGEALKRLAALMGQNGLHN